MADDDVEDEEDAGDEWSPLAVDGANDKPVVSTERCGVVADFGRRQALRCSSILASRCWPRAARHQVNACCRGTTRRGVRRNGKAASSTSGSMQSPVENLR